MLGSFIMHIYSITSTTICIQRSSTRLSLLAQGIRVHILGIVVNTIAFFFKHSSVFGIWSSWIGLILRPLDSISALFDAYQGTWQATNMCEWPLLSYIILEWGLTERLAYHNQRVTIYIDFNVCVKQAVKAFIAVKFTLYEQKHL